MKICINEWDPNTENTRIYPLLYLRDIFSICLELSFRNAILSLFSLIKTKMPNVFYYKHLLKTNEKNYREMKRRKW